MICNTNALSLAKKSLKRVALVVFNEQSFFGEEELFVEGGGMRKTRAQVVSAEAEVFVIKK